MQDEIRPFSIWTRAYEEKIDRKNGFELGRIQNRQKIPGNIDASNNGIIGYGKENNTSKVEKILKKYENVSGFSAMYLKNENELFEHINVIYDLMYHHYILGKKDNYSFPRFECCPSSQNLMVAGMMMGYSNASVLGNNNYDHYYTAFPFLLNGEKGLIIADPTSDQLWAEKDVRPRNHIFVVKHGKWKYKTDWANGRNLYPDGYLNLSTFREDIDNWDNYNKRIDKFFKNVFRNPIRVGVEVPEKSVFSGFKNFYRSLL